MIDATMFDEAAAHEVVEKDTALSPLELAEVLQGRSSFYRTLSSLYYATLRQDQIDQLAGTDFSAFGAEDPLLVEGFNDLRRYLRKRNTGTRQELAVDFTSAFIGTKVVHGLSAVPYESVYKSEDGLLMQEPRNEVYRIYKKVAIKLKEGVNLPEDHLAFELEFMAVMSERAASLLLENASAESPDGKPLSSEDLDTQVAQQVLENLQLQRSFLSEHILSWFKEFSDRASSILKTRFYHGVLKITEGYLMMDVDTLDGLIAEVSE